VRLTSVLRSKNLNTGRPIALKTIQLMRANRDRTEITDHTKLTMEANGRPRWIAHNKEARWPVRRLRNIPLAAADAIRLIPKELPISRSGFGILVDRHQDCADVVIAPPLMHPNSADLC
jgi:hypothetical protein